MSVETTLMVLVLALGFEAAFGYPDVLYRKIGHPVTWIGRIVAFLDTRLNRVGWSFGARRLAGVVTLVVILAASALLAFLIQNVLANTTGGVIVLALIAGTLIAGRGLYQHVRDVAVALEAENLVEGRVAVARIVGRDPQTLDAHGVARAAIESLAENASDGVVAPVFWFALLGLPGLAAYKAINTADSMIGHRTERFEAFGWAAARIDDLVNLPAARLTGLLFALAAAAMPGASAPAALRTMWRDASKHRSPNAGWPESAMAGALGLKLNGPRHYGGKLVTDAFMGDGRAEATPKDIRRALSLSIAAWATMVVALAALWLNVRS